MKIYLQLNDNKYLTGWANIRGLETDIEFEIDINDDFFKFPHSIYSYQDGKLIKDENLLLEKVKNRKLFDLNKNRENENTKDFSFVINDMEYEFSSNISEIQSAYFLLNNKLVDSVEINAKKNGEFVTVSANEETIKQLILRAYEIKKQNDLKFKSYLTLIKEMKSIDEIKKIKW